MPWTGKSSKVGVPPIPTATQSSVRGPGSAGIPCMILCWAFRMYWPCKGLCGWENGLRLETGEPRSCDPLCVALGWQAHICRLYCADVNNLCLHFHGDLCTVLCCKVKAYLTV